MANVDDDMGAEAIHPNNEETNENNTLEDEIGDNINPEEYELLDAKLDDLNIALDLIEQKNDRIHTEFLKLLHSSKQIREELQQEMQKNKDILEDEHPKEK